MEITEEMLKIVGEAFNKRSGFNPLGIKVETETDGQGHTRIIIDKFLALEPTTVTVKSILAHKNVPGWLATDDRGEDVCELYKGPSFWSALSELTQAHAMFRVRQLQDKYDPCLIPNGRDDNGTI